MKLNILGTEYKFKIMSEDEEPRLKDNWGFTDYYAKEIRVRDDIEKETEETCKNLKDFKNKVIRHEIVHAFLYESGLCENSYNMMSWAQNEEMVDWIAIQSPKIFALYKKLNVM